MRVTYLFLAFLLSGQSLFSEVTSRPKIGLALSGGGAMGFAHIGTLKLLDSLDIPIDYIAGTSMGGIVSALYAVGFSGMRSNRSRGKRTGRTCLLTHPLRQVLPYLPETGCRQVSVRARHPRLPSGRQRRVIAGQKITLYMTRLVCHI
jgi:NTE family protein